MGGALRHGSIVYVHINYPQLTLMKFMCQIQSQIKFYSILNSQIKASGQSARRALRNETEKIEALEADRPSGNVNGGTDGHASGGGKKRPLRRIASPSIDCQSAGHEETIAAQKAALSEMRQRLQYLSSNTSNGLCKLSFLELLLVKERILALNFVVSLTILFRFPLQGLYQFSSICFHEFSGAPKISSVSLLLINSDLLQILLPL